MSEISKGYEPAAVEAKWYAQWLESGVFVADPASSKPAYSIVIPPPNVTGVLTLGHVLNNTIQDILARRARMQGKEVLWLPGTDHAGIATQTVVERQLRKQEKKTRRDLGREAFVERVWEWKEKHGGIIIDQLKKLGCSCDWTRERFTMDMGYSARVQEVFVDLYNKGLIYRGKRMVNWCPASLTALSDEEVIMKPQKGTLFFMRYEIVEEPGTFLEIATTRPETLMGDTAVAVNPEDGRYARFVGKHCWRPFPRAKIQIVGDAHIDPKFGTGVLKVTPAHDNADFEIGQRHGLEAIDVMHPDGRLNELAGEEFSGIERFEARKLAVEKLRDLGLLVKEEPYQNNVGFSERADVPIEPRLSEQWFLRYPKTQESLDAVLSGEVRFRPERWAKVYEHWLTNIQDWCISRQLWWGHRIPAWYGADGAIHVGAEAPAEGEWQQDEDVLDTWFSSWLWPFATMDEPTREKFYPTTDLVTGPDIIFFWVARMIMAGYEYEGRRPFDNVFFTGLIRDGQGRKMSKSLGNSPDPLDLIAKYGADGLRFGLMRIAPQGQDIRFDEKQIEEGRNFANKLWNACRFRQMQGPSEAAVDLRSHTLSQFALDIVGKLDALTAAQAAAFAEYRFSEAAQGLYDFFWGEYCDSFIEAAKSDILDDSRARQSTLAVMDYVISRTLRLLHPFMPHITEELWALMGLGEGSIMFAPLPEQSGLEAEAIAAAGSVAQSVYAAAGQGRNLRAEYRIASNKKAGFILKPAGSGLGDDVAGVLWRLLNAEESSVIDPAFAAQPGVPTVLTDLGQLYMPLEGLIDVGAERERLEKELAKVENELATVRRKLSSESFVSNAPGAVVEEHRKRESDWQARLAQLREMLAALR